MKPEITKTRSWWTFVALVLLLLVLLPQSVQANGGTKQWVGPHFNNLWTNPNNWDPAGEPGPGDEVFLTQSGSFPKTVIYNTSSNPTLTSVTLDATGSGTITLKQSGNALTADDEIVGDSGTGRFIQSGGTNKITSDLTLGAISTGSGTYNLKNGSLSVVNYEYIGDSGTGKFVQSGGTNQSTHLHLGHSSGGSGTYQMSGPDSILKVGVSFYMGAWGTGTFIQRDGTATVSDSLVLGYDDAAKGTYRLSGGNLTAKYEYVGHYGEGTFSQTGGTNNANWLWLGAWRNTSKGTYKLIGGDLLVGREELGYLGTGNLTQTGGSHTVTNLTLGNTSTGSGTYNLKLGSLSITNNETIGNYGTGSFIQTGGTNKTQGLYLGYWSTGSGTYRLSNGTLPGNYEWIGYNGEGTFIHTGGTHTAGSLVLGAWSNTAKGTYNLSGTGNLYVAFENIGRSGTGIFNQTGGSHTVGYLLSLGTIPGTSGTYNLKGGTLAVNDTEEIGRVATGSFTQTGGKHTVTNTLTLAVAPGSNGTYNLEGGKLTAGTIQINAPSGGGAGGTFNVMKTITTVTGNVVNNGKVTTTNATVTWDGNFTNNGAYISDPSTQKFTGDVEVGATGYLVGHSQDLFIIKGDFLNKSENTTDWDTAPATLKFAEDASGDTEHNFFIPGADKGQNSAGYTENYAWGTLKIAGQTVHLFDANDDGVGAQYVGELIGASRSGTTVTNIYGDDDSTLNIYYNPDLLANFYLRGRTYDYAGGLGQLMPSHTPLPPSVLLMGSGLLGLGLLGWRRKRS